MSEPADNTPALGRICLFGGTFDPVHLGHIAAAELAMPTMRRWKKQD